MSLPLLLTADLPAALTLLASTILAAILFRARGRLYDLARAATPDPAPPSERRVWPRFHDRLRELELQPELERAIVAYARGMHDDAPEALLTDRAAFDRFVAQLLSRPEAFEDRHALLRSLKRLREALDIFPAHGQALISTRELEVGTWLELRADHPDDDSEAKAPLARVLVTDSDDEAIEVESQEPLTLPKEGELWVCFRAEGRTYRFRTGLLGQDAPDSARLAHGPFLITEKRAAPRVRMRARALLSWRGRRVSAAVLDLSEGGCALASPVLIPLDSAFSCRLHLSGRGHDIAATVRDVSPLNGLEVRLHCRFDELDDTSLAALRATVQKALEMAEESSSGETLSDEASSDALRQPELAPPHLP